MKAIVWASALNLCVAASADAQLAQDIATDKELFAAYCLGQIEQSGIHYGRGFGMPDIDGPLIRDIKDRTSQLKAYLAARGFLGVRGPQARNGIALAAARGHSDESTCRTHISACVLKCSPSGRAYDPKCTEECRDSDRSCNAVARCERSDELPF